MSKVTTVTAKLPEFGIEEICPEIPIEVYQARLRKTVERMNEAKLDCLVVYGDREHFANLSYLSGFDPRFEEALILLDKSGQKTLIAGNECMGYLPDEKLGFKPVLFQEFSLMGQPRQSSRPLRKILSDFNVKPGVKIGCVGWKYYDTALIDNAYASDLPAYIIDLLRDLTGDKRCVANATEIFMNPKDGLRAINEAEQIAMFEYASIRTSEATRNLLLNIKEGVREQNLEKYLDGYGLPLTCHRMISFGQKAKRGLASASANKAKLGDPYTVAFGINGALNCRAGVVARSLDDLPSSERDFYWQFAVNYFEVISTWYEELGLGSSTGKIFKAVDSVRNSKLFTFGANPGHLIHLDEWVHSPFSADSKIKLVSGMALQMDIIPVSQGPFYYINAEDGIVIADEGLQIEIKNKYPNAYGRMLKRRQFIKEVVGISLDDSVLPLSNIPVWLPPFVLSPDTILSNVI